MYGNAASTLHFINNHDNKVNANDNKKRIVSRKIIRNANNICYGIYVNKMDITFRK